MYPGYRNFEPQVAFDLKTTKTVLKELAKFHTSFLAVKLKKPEIFKHKIKPYINTNDKLENVTINDTKAVISRRQENEACVSLIPRIRRATYGNGKSSTREPFATIPYFQKFTYGSPAADLIFFLFTSVKKLQF
ncbi:hypothetical protein NQ317_016740 [Molorchus minor]|uniref:Uncharacterized protein n=1 Tax=Molorchus minor TaxID=1323400 RepID=A0ABQ9IV59_9CUCU|nr:hypothetical protein NQ317_016740 [Molorchus minor]